MAQAELLRQVERLLLKAAGAVIAAVTAENGHLLPTRLPPGGENSLRAVKGGKNTEKRY